MLRTRVDRLMVTTAIVLLLSAGGTFAQQPDAAAEAAKVEAPSADASTVEVPSADIPKIEANAAPTAAVDPETTSAVSPDSKPAAATAVPATDSAPAPAAAAPAPEEKAAAATPAAAAVDGNTPIAQELRDLATGKYDSALKQDRPTIDAFYSGRDYAPIWLTDGKPNDRAKAAIAYLAQVDADGLDPADYPAPNLAGVTDPEALADAEVKLTSSVLTYTRHASIGRVHWSRVSSEIEYQTKPPEAVDVLAALVGATDVAAVLASYEPHAREYLALKAKLAELRGGKASNISPIAYGAVLKVGGKTDVTDDRVPALRERLGADGDGTVYDKALAEAVKKFQQQHKLAPSGTLTAATIDALNGRTSSSSTDLIVANMERWRWMPHELGDTYVLVNLTDYMLHVMHNGKQVWETKIVDGKPTSPTPIMTGEMRSITINPTWNVPPNIANNEYLPLLRQDPTILTRMGLNVTHNPDGSIHLSQPPGPQNALGQIRFNFPNKFLVYQHDSNQKYLFATVDRDQSHGCMRVENPVKYAEVLLSLVRPGEGYSENRIHGMFGGREAEIRFPATVPVHLTYQTAVVDEHGRLETHADIYGRDRALLAVLKGDDRRIADSAVEHRDNLVRREALAMPEQAFSGWQGQNIFSRLFGGFGGGYAAAPQRRAAR